MIVQVLTAFGLATLLLAAERAGADDDFEAAVLKDGKHALPYRLLKPAPYDPHKKYPLVLFLHGAGERGTDNQAQLKHFVRMFATPQNRAKYPAFVLAPQCPPDEKWSDNEWFTDRVPLPERPAPSMAMTLKLVAELERKVAIDPSRRYVTGLSMGGYGTWDAVLRHPDMFAAALPICGGGDERLAARIAKLPVWVFHGAADTAVKPALSRRMVEALRKAGGKPKYTEYRGVGHDAWTPASKEPDLLAWLFAQKRK